MQSKQAFPIPTGASFSGAYGDLTGRPTFATVATSGLYTDLAGRPSLSTVATSGVYTDLTGRPTFATVATSGSYGDLTGKPTLGGAASLNVGTTAGTVAAGDDSRFGAGGGGDMFKVDNLSGLSNYATARTNLGLATVAATGAYTDLSGRPTLATVATSGAYTDLSGRPPLATVATSGAYNDLSGKPTLGDAAAKNTGTTAGTVAAGDDSRLSGGPAFAAYQSSAQSLAANTNTKISLQSEDFDTAGAFDSATNYRFQPTTAGYYQINGAVVASTNVGQCIAFIYKNGTTAHKNGVNGAYGSVVSSLVYLNGSTDFIELWAVFVTGANTNASANQTYFNGCFMRA